MLGEDILPSPKDAFAEPGSQFSSQEGVATSLTKSTYAQKSWALIRFLIPTAYISILKHIYVFKYML